MSDPQDVTAQLKIENRYHGGGVPSGMKVVRRNKGKQLKRDPEKIKFLERIVRERRAGRTFRQIGEGMERDAAEAEGRKPLP